MINILIGILTITVTVIVYLLARKLHQKYPSSLLLPIITATAAIVILLLLFRIPYETYMIGGEWINKLLGPAVVSLAYPLYQNIETLKKLIVPLIAGTITGAVVGITTGVWLTKWAGFANSIIYSITPKSVTAPVAMEIAQSIEGIVPLAVVFVMIAGISGAMTSSFLFQLFKINNEASRGIGLGCGSHAIGTASAMSYSSLTGSISSISMVLSAIIVSIITPPLIMVLL
jgi:predicted murein hydrolase (TIGR00659 family)